MKNLSNQIEDIFQERFHGAVNIRGIKFQILYSVLRSFDLYSNPSLNAVILEGIEDIDIKGVKKPELKRFQILNQFIQIKTSVNNWNWSNLKQKKVVENFLEVWKIDPSAEFLMVSNFGYQDKLDELVKFCNGSKTKISKKLEQELEKIFKSQGLKKKDISSFLKKLSFQRISEEEIISQINGSIVKHYQLETNNYELYFLSLIARFLNWSVNRREVNRQNLEEVKHFVQDQIDLGTSNLAVQNGWLEKLSFTADARADDYYEGTNARPGHIEAGLDVERNQWLEEIKKILEVTGTCIIRTASGQGKSTLLYRYAFQNYQPETTFIVKNLSDETMVGSLKKAILAKKTLGLPILVLIDNVSADLRYWYRLVGELAEYKIKFIVTIREEDWFRYSGGVTGFRWKILTPELTLGEARKIYAEFKEKGKIAAGVTSAEQSFEQVSDRKLLLEFTYLITHGQMLSERLREQIQRMQEMKEDKAKLHILRLVSVAQIYQSKIATESLINNVEFSDDPDLTLESLRKEYLLFNEDGCEGLHLVRSQHLAEILHRVIPVENTIKELIRILDTENLANFVAYVFSDPRINKKNVLQTLVKRCSGENLETITQVAEALFTANERNYFNQNKHLFEEAKALASNGIFFLTSATMPFTPYDVLADFGGILGDNEAFKTFFENLMLIRDKFLPRDWQNRTDVAFLNKILVQMSDEKLLTEFENSGEFLSWYRLPDLETTRIREMLANSDWEQNLTNISVSALAEFLFNLFYFLQETYQSLLQSKKVEIQNYFKKQTETLTVKEQDEDIFIEFIVEEGDEKKELVHEQAVNRLNLLYKMFPFYEHYASQGLYAADFGVERAVDDTKKNIPVRIYSLGNEAAKNAIYSKIIDAHYAVSSVYDWQKEWFEFRRDVSKLFSDCIEVSQAASLGKTDNLEKFERQYHDLIERCGNQSQLPEYLGERIKNAQRNINSWFGSVQTFLSQVFQTDENARRLCRVNLRDAASRLFKAQDGFKTITEESQSYFDFSALDEGEIEKYFYLADVFDVLYGDAKDFPVRNIKTHINKKKRKQINDINESLHHSFAPLEEDGFSFVYPSKLLIKSVESGGLETSICICFEVVDFAKELEQIEIIIRSFPSFEDHFWNLYMIPLFDGKRYTENLWQISFFNISRLVSGEQVGAWALLPQPIDKEILSILPALQRIEIPEILAVANFKIVCAELHVIRKTRSFLTNKLNAESEADKFLANLYQEKLQLQTNKVMETCEIVLDKLGDLIEKVQDEKPSAKELAAWVELMHICLERYKKVTESVNEDLSDDENKTFWFDREIETLLGYYLNIKYKKFDSYEL